MDGLYCQAPALKK